MTKTARFEGGEKKVRMYQLTPSFLFSPPLATFTTSVPCITFHTPPFFESKPIYNQHLYQLPNEPCHIDISYTNTDSHLLLSVKPVITTVVVLICPLIRRHTTSFHYTSPDDVLCVFEFTTLNDRNTLPIKESISPFRMSHCPINSTFLLFSSLPHSSLVPEPFKHASSKPSPKLPIPSALVHFPLYPHSLFPLPPPSPFPSSPYPSHRPHCPGREEMQA